MCRCGRDGCGLGGLLEAFERVARSAGLTMVREHGGTGRLETWLAEQRKRLKIEAK